MRKSATVLLGLFLGLGLLAGVARAAEKVVTLEFASFMPPTDKLSMTLRDFGKDMETKTAGRVKVNFHPGGTLVPPQQTYDGVLKEIVDIGEATLDITAGRFPLMEVLSLPLGVKSSAVMTKLANEFYEKFKPKELDGVKVLFFTTPGQQYIHTKKPVRKLEDLKGMKLRCAGGAVVSVVKALGAVPVVMPLSDTYDALSKGVVDGVMSPWNGLEAFRFYEVVDYSTLNYRTSVSPTGFVVMNKGKWNSLPSDVQKVIDQLSDEYAGKLSVVWDTKDQEGVKNSTARKHQVIALSSEEDEKWHQRIVPLYEAYVRDKSAKGLPAAEALAWCQEWVKKNQK